MDLQKLKLYHARSLVILAGGLGNQLFQLAFGLFHSQEGFLQLERSLGRPRANTDNLPELASFELPSGVEFSGRRTKISRILRPSYLPRKITNYCFQNLGTSQKESLLRKKIFDFIMSIFLMRRVHVNISGDVGFFETSSLSPRDIYIGYFQSFKWANGEHVFNKLMKLKIKNPSKKFLDLEEEIKKTSPTIVHVRRGDYKQQRNFGLVPKQYFQTALAQLGGLIRPIWIFSDEPEEAIEILDFVNEHQRRIIGPNELSPAETLQLMRHGTNFVISNSTFSWWAAFLRINREGKVVAPNPWFAIQPTPKHLIPSDWILVDPWTK